MSKYDLPDLPSDEELGITEEDREQYEDSLPEDRPELSKEEMAALLGQTFSPKAAGAARAGSGPKKAGEKKKRKAGAKGSSWWARWRARRAAGQGEKDAGRTPSAAAAPPAGASGTAARTPAASAAPPSSAPVSAPAAAAGSATAQPAPTRARLAPEGPRSRWRGPVTLAFLVGLTAWASSFTGLPRPVPANASDTVFSSSRAMSSLIEIAQRPHPTGSPEHARVRSYLVERLRGLGLEPEVQTTLSVVQGQEALRAATVRNVIARLPGTASTGAVLVTAHYDSRELSPGAGDDGSGVVTILEALRALRTGGALRNDVIVLFTDAEELGLLGARAFVDQHPWIADVALVLSFEMRGAGGPSIMFETNDRNGWVVRALDELDPAPEPYANSLAYEVYRRMSNDTDFAPFKNAGKQGLNFAAIGRANVYHQSTDRPESLSEATLQHHGLRALAALRHFGRADLGVVDAPNVVYFTAPLLGLVVYDATWVLPISGALVVLLLAVALIGLRRGARPAGMATGLGVAVLGGALAYGLAWGLARWVPRFHAEGGTLDGSLYHSEGWYVLATAAGALALVTALHALARRWLSPLELLLGALLVPLVLAVGAGFAAPLGAMNLQWPVAAALLAALVLALLPRGSSWTPGWLVFLVLTLPVFALLVPLAELLWLSLSFGLLGVVAVLAAVTLQLSLPALDALRHPNGWWAPLTGAVLAAGFLGLGVASAEARADRPAPSTLVYAYEHGTGSAYWVTDPRADLLLDAEAIAWAEERAGAPFGATQDLTGFGLRWEAAPVATAPVVSATPPEVVVTRDTIDGNARRVTLAVRSRIGAERLTFMRDPAARLRFLAVDGTAVDQPGSLELVEHWGVPDSMLVLELDMPADAPIAVHVVESHYRPEELLGPGSFARPDELAPDVSAGSDRAVLRYSVAAFADPRHAFMPAPSDSVGPAGAAPPAVAPPPASGAAPDSAALAGPDSAALAAPASAAPAAPDSAAPDSTARAAPDSAGLAAPDAASLAAPSSAPRAAPDTLGSGR